MPSKDLVSIYDNQNLQIREGVDTDKAGRAVEQLIDLVVEFTNQDSAKVYEALNYYWTHFGYRPVRAVLESGLLTDIELRQIINSSRETMSVEPRQLNIEAVERVGVETCLRLRVVPVQWDADGRLLVVTEKTATHSIKTEIQEKAECEIIWKTATDKAQISSCLTTIEHHLTKTTTDTAAPPQFQELNASRQRYINLTTSGDASPVSTDPVSKAMLHLITGAIASQASDIHLSAILELGTGHTVMTARLRRLGLLELHDTYPEKIGLALMNRFRIAGDMSIDMTKPDDGRYDITTADDQRFDLRILFSPTITGGMLVIRILPQERPDLENLITLFPLEDSSHYEELIELMHAPDGIILITGPTGSGKSTTMAALLAEVCRPEIKVVTIENPVEYIIPGADQVQVHKENLSFADAMRGFLRADPDVIMLGEIRDPETADSAIWAAQTGHSVISTLHVRDAAGAHQRILDMAESISAVSLAGSLIGVLAQRLVRVACKCVKHKNPTTGETTIRIPEMYEGCGGCSKGWSGRRAIAELLCITPPIAEAILRNAGASEIQSLENYPTLREHARILIEKGITTQLEAERVVGKLYLNEEVTPDAQ